jgi:hypothetical protein
MEVATIKKNKMVAFTDIFAAGIARATGFAWNRLA